MITDKRWALSGLKSSLLKAIISINRHFIFSKETQEFWDTLTNKYFRIFEIPKPPYIPFFWDILQAENSPFGIFYRLKTALLGYSKDGKQSFLGYYKGGKLTLCRNVGVGGWFFSFRKKDLKFYYSVFLQENKYSLLY
jgi:hypothetical protein